MEILGFGLVIFLASVIGYMAFCSLKIRKANIYSQKREDQENLFRGC